MKQLNNYIIEKILITKGTKPDSHVGEPILYISHSGVTSTKSYVSCYYYEISGETDDTVNLKSHKFTFDKVAHTPNSKFKYIYAQHIDKSNDDFGYIILKKDAVNVLQEILNKPKMTFETPECTWGIEKQLGIRRDDTTLEAYLKNILSWYKNGKS